MITIGAAKFARSMKRRARKEVAHLERATVQALNKVGRWSTVQARRELGGLLNVRASTLRGQERVFRASRRRMQYRTVYRRREFRVEELKGTRFAQLKRAGGRLRFRAYGKSQTLTGVQRRERAGRTVYVVPRGRSRRAGQWRLRNVRGTFIKADYRGPARVKREVGPRFRRELRRLLAARRKHGRRF